MLRFKPLGVFLVVASIMSTISSAKDHSTLKGRDLTLTDEVKSLAGVPPNVFEITEIDPGQFLVGARHSLTEKDLTSFLDRQPDTAIAQGIFLQCKTKLGRGDSVLLDYCVRRNADFYLEVPLSKLPYVSRNRISLLVQRRSEGAGVNSETK